MILVQRISVKFKWLLSHFIKTRIMGCIEAGNSDLNILHINENFLVVNKCCDIPINSDTPDVHPVTVATQLQYKFPHLYDPTIKFGFRFCHRLDYSTSGALCVALNKNAAKEAYKVFYSGKSEKYYLALVYGHVIEDIMIIEKSIGVDSRSEYSHCMCSSDKEYCESARFSATKLLVLQRGFYNSKPATKVLLKLVTGRRHQIRVHCQEIGHTIVGDFTYSNRKDVIPYRMFLHAFRLVMPTEIEKLDIMTEDPFSENNPRNKWVPNETVNKLNEETFLKLKYFKV